MQSFSRESLQSFLVVEREESKGDYRVGGREQEMGTPILNPLFESATGGET